MKLGTFPTRSLSKDSSNNKVEPAIPKLFAISGCKAPITPNTANYANGNATYGYTAILADSDVAYLNVARGGKVNTEYNPTVVDFIGDSGNSVSVIGTRFEVVAKAQPVAAATTTLTIIGNETGGYVNITITVDQETTATNIVDDYYYEK